MAAKLLMEQQYSSKHLTTLAWVTFQLISLGFISSRKDNKHYHLPSVQ